MSILVLVQVYWCRRRILSDLSQSKVMILSPKTRLRKENNPHNNRRSGLMGFLKTIIQRYQTTLESIFLILGILDLPTNPLPKTKLTKVPKIPPKSTIPIPRT